MELASTLADLLHLLLQAGREPLDAGHQRLASGLQLLDYHVEHGQSLSFYLQETGKLLRALLILPGKESHPLQKM